MTNPKSLRSHFHLTFHERGMTLVELMVAMTIGLFLTAGIISLFTVTKQSYRAAEAMSRLQENGRLRDRIPVSRCSPGRLQRSVCHQHSPACECLSSAGKGHTTRPARYPDPRASLPTTPPYTANTDVFHNQIRTAFFKPHSNSCHNLLHRHGRRW